MDPVSALVLGCVVAWCMTRAAGEAAVDQARAEARAAASAVRSDLNARREAWAGELAARLASGRKGGPSTPLWWGWAAFRTAGAIRGALSSAPREAERPQAIRGTVGPFRRIWEAGQRGAGYAADEARRQRDAKQQPTRVPVGVCGRCGNVVARSALEWDLANLEYRCVMCRASQETGSSKEQETPKESDRTAADVVDAEVIDQPTEPNPRPPIPDPALPAAPAGTPEPAPLAEPAQVPPRHNPQLEAPSTGPAAPADRPINPSEIEGDQMAPRHPGQVVATRAGSGTALARPANGSSGESYTHGQFNRAVTDIEKRLDELPSTLQAMLQSLTTADAGRAQVLGVLATREDIVAFMTQVRAMLAEVNRRERPVLAAVNAAGGPDQVPSFAYLRNV